MSEPLRLYFESDYASLDITFDMSPKCVEACANINGFWSNDESRMLEAEDDLEGFTRKESLVCHCAAKVLIGFCLGNLYEDTDSVRRWLLCGQEGWPTSLEDYGITYRWEMRQPHPDDFDLTTAEAF